ncbi:phage portal protein [Enterococcus caccae]|uniref:SPP1 family phage portal protein n=1 Tax=Enterococcus caccae ATCC BAA-1240 TaxID=1158612 RepID=R3TW20_9ENTE|nr:phage portal protein [Enterococcus caccae]EOL45809.1 SPP1 family phage portal protein [Enterococcus caccae ATCC BAA-1240]EOT61005.1 SPP1 family phage portal protein [Enterococcus caccae ATCC BAA-1240]OJG27964.1 SPP1 family phage portal protein [Enterococcus caccae]
MAIKIDRELAGDINNPSLELIAYVIKEHKKDIPRLQMLFDYYDGKPHKIGKDVTDTPHDRGEVYVNNAKYVTDNMVGFTVGSPISYAAAKGKNIDPIIDAFNLMKIKKHDKELEKDLSVFGIGYELHYLSVKPGTALETVLKITKIDPRGIILVVDDTVDNNKLFAVRFIEKFDLKGKRTGFMVEVYTSKFVIYYFTKSLNMKDAVISKTKPHYYGDVPVVEYRNNEEKQGDYEQQLSQIDGYNKLQTDRIKDKENFVKAIMILYGFSLPEEKPEEVNGSLVIQDAPVKSEGASAEYLTNTFQESEVQVLAKALIDDFHKTSYVPDLNDEKFGGNISGEAMKYKLLGLLLALATKIGYFEDGLVQRLKLTENMLRVKAQKVDAEGAKITFKPNLPINRKDVIDQIKESQEFVPLLISLGWLDDIDDPKEAIELLNEQKEENIKLAQKAAGVQSEDSHSDLDDPPEEGEEND